MFIKKSILAISLLALATVANANLRTENYTNEDSSVYVTSVAKPRCSSDAGPQYYTPKMNADGSPGVSNVKDNEIALLCLTSKNNTCTAKIFNNNNCSGASVGFAELNLKTKTVSVVKSTDARYDFISKNGGTLLEVRYK